MTIKGRVDLLRNLHGLTRREARHVVHIADMCTVTDETAYEWSDRTRDQELLKAIHWKLETLLTVALRTEQRVTDVERDKYLHPRDTRDNEYF